MSAVVVDSPPDTRARGTATRFPFVLASFAILSFLVFGALTLAWLEFSSGLENLNVATVLELRRGDEGTRWLVPTLEGEPRTAKPPLTAWITAMFVSPNAVRALDAPEPAVRDAAYRALAWSVRAPGLLSTCAMLLAAYALARAVSGDAGTAAIAVAVCASTLYLARFGRQATTDVQLALWFTVANALLARHLLAGATWPAALACGLALGLALMSKGPVALAQSVLPAAVFAGLLRRLRPHDDPSRQRSGLAKLLVGATVMVVVGGAWYAIVLARVPGVWSRWVSEVTRVGATDNAGGNPLSYASIFALMMPWTLFFVIGAIEVGRAVWWRMNRNRAPAASVGDERAPLGLALPLLLVVVPIVVMSFFPDRKDRYLLPLAAPASVLAARGLVATARAGRAFAWTFTVHWWMLALIAIALPVAGALWWKRLDGSPWFAPRAAIGAAVAGLSIVGLGLLTRRSWRAGNDGREPLGAVVATTFVLVLLGNTLLLLGYRDSREGRSEMRPLAEALRRALPEARLYTWRPDGRRKRAPVDLSIYANRRTVWTDDPAALPRDPLDRPQVYVTIHKKDDPPPVPAPGWLPFLRVARDGDHFEAFVRMSRRE